MRARARKRRKGRKKKKKKAKTQKALENSFTPGGLEAGCDEAGRGCLAGPVVAAAVILPDDFRHPWLKKMQYLL